MEKPILKPIIMKRNYFADLDALRLFAFLVVFFAHCFIYETSIIREINIWQLTFFLIRSAHIAICMFFVLSGFLITYLLIDEQKKKGKIELAKYYQRRMLRIFPLFYFVLALVFIAYPLFSKWFLHREAIIAVTRWKYFLFLNNFDLINRGANIPTLVILWSVGVEVQFYLAWPLLFLLFRNRLWIPIAAMILTTAIFRYTHYAVPDLMHFSTLSCLNDLAVGCGLAWLYQHRQELLVSWFARRKKPVLIIFYSLFAIYLVMWAGVDYTNPWGAVADRIIVSLGFAFILAEQIMSPHSILKLRHSGFLSKLGTITYGLYCYHYIFIGLMFTLLSRSHVLPQVPAFIVSSLLALGGTILAGRLSFRYYENYFLGLKKY